nr:MAG TPA: hypothetical protein [Caudoviricetes sp.]
MIRQFYYIADCSDNFSLNFIYRKLNSILLVYSDRTISSFISGQFLKVQSIVFAKRNRIRNIKHYIYTTFIPANYIRLETMLLITGLSLLIQFFQVFLVKCYYHTTFISCKDSNLYL